MARLSVRSLDKFFGPRHVLRDVCFDAGNRQAVVLFGPSGCGKTTLLRILAGLEPPHRGEVLFDGRAFNSGRVFVPPESRGIGMVFQGLALWPHMTVQAHLDFVLRDTVRSRKEREARTAELLSQFGLSSLAQTRPVSLSGGEQQRLAIARALAGQPPLLLLDEPFSHLDDEWRGRVIEELKARKRSGAVLLMATHRRDDLHELGDVVLKFSGTGTATVTLDVSSI